MNSFEKESFFSIFRYQLLPVSNDIQLSFVEDFPFSSIEELKSRKNEFFTNALHDIRKFIYSRAEVVHKIKIFDDEIIFLLFGHQRFVNVHDKEFNPNQVEDYPSTRVFINNNPAVQKIAVEHNRVSFNSPEAVIKMFEQNISRYLKKYYLRIYIEPTFEKEEFWHFVDENKEKITQVNFELISPNMANISGALKIDLSRLNKDTNTHKTIMQLNSEKHSHLTLDKNSELVNSLVDYSSQGGAGVSVKIRGIRKRFEMKEKIKEIAIDEISLGTENIQEMKSLLKDLLH